MLTPHVKSLAFGSAVAGALALPAHTQDRTALLAEGSTVPGLPGAVVDSLSNTAVNSTGGRAVSSNVDDGSGITLSLVWGRGAAGDVDTVLFQEGTFGTCEQTSWEGFFGLADDGSVFYSPSCNDTVTLETSLDNVFLNSMPVAEEGQPIASLPGKVFRFNSRPTILASGDPVWIGGIDDEMTGDSEGNGLFFGLGQTALLRTGDQPPNVAFPLDGNAVDFDFRFSPDGTQYITLVDMLSGSSLNDGRMVLNGAGLDLGGAPVEEDTPIPTSVGGQGGEAWDNFDFFGILDDGTYLMTGDTNGNVDTDEFVFLGDSMLYREGDTLPDGNVLVGSIEGASLAPNGDLGLVWDVEDGAGDDIEAVIFNGRVVAKEGDAIDATGDGVVDPNAIIVGFSGISSLTTATDQKLYVTADIDLLGTTTTQDDIEVYLEIAVSPFENLGGTEEISLSAGGEQELSLFLPREVEADFYLVLGSASGTMPGTPAGLFNLPLNFDAYTQFTLDSANSSVLSSSFGALDAFNTATTTFSLPAGSNPAVAGTTLHHAYLTLDITSVLDISFVSEAVQVALIP